MKGKVDQTRSGVQDASSCKAEVIYSASNSFATLEKSRPVRRTTSSMAPRVSGGIRRLTGLVGIQSPLSSLRSHCRTPTTQGWLSSAHAPDLPGEERAHASNTLTGIRPWGFGRRSRRSSVRVRRGRAVGRDRTWKHPGCRSRVARAPAWRDCPLPVGAGPMPKDWCSPESGSSVPCKIKR